MAFIDMFSLISPLAGSVVPLVGSPAGLEFGVALGLEFGSNATLHESPPFTYPGTPCPITLLSYSSKHGQSKSYNPEPSTVVTHSKSKPSHLGYIPRECRRDRNTPPKRVPSN
eukprot:CAMPEP_0194366210 /NCGR_PEP_ID=MMETSP0174-20130528/14237_1 /TAXON_ID=216777 /ORGANISM="Proboscia alata, Strain PI-D3" /LENGTH=112 /DNA_ID=CAMNT_0039141273 /DNA_START=151 /DNA_END=489 /DNA_ORIENTATION=-